MEGVNDLEGKMVEGCLSPGAPCKKGGAGHMDKLGLSLNGEGCQLIPETHGKWQW